MQTTEKSKRNNNQKLALPCRYYRVFTDVNVPCLEENFHFVERTLPLPAGQCALILVDVWNTLYIDSYIERSEEIIRTRILPLVEAARRAGMMIIHAPSPQVADRYASEPSTMNAAGPTADWPPQEFRSIYRGGEFSAFGRAAEPRLAAAIERYKTELDISDLIRPLPGEWVIHDGQQLHELLTEQKILHLIYAGFATNWCILTRDYGTTAMKRRGYNIILLRDATTGIEWHDTVKTEAATQTAIRDIETRLGWSATTGDFIKSCNDMN